MSRQRAGWGVAKWMEKNRLRLKSKTAGVNKYDPQTATRINEAARRLKQLKNKLERRKDESREG